MRVFALGGYGKVGLPATRLLAQSDLVTEIAVAGRSLERAQAAAAEIGEKAVAVQADGTDEDALASLVSGYDVIVNASTDEAVIPAIQAAIRTGAHYCDAAVVDEKTLQLAARAETVGIAAIIANGVHPCISNLMGVHAARQLDDVEQLQLGFASMFNWQTGLDLMPRQWVEEPRESLTVLHDFEPFIAMMLGGVQKYGSKSLRIYDDGRWLDSDPVRNGLDGPLTQGITITAYPYASFDPLWGSLPQELSGASPVEMFFSPLPPQLHNVLRKQALRVLDGDSDSDAATSSFYDTVESDPERWLTPPDDFALVPKMWVRAVGRKEGRAARYTCWLTAPTLDVAGYLLTSVALAVAARGILRGEIRKRGVMTAETTFEPLPFLDEVATLLPDTLPDGRLIDESFDWLE